MFQGKKKYNRNMQRRPGFLGAVDQKRDSDNANFVKIL